MRSSHLKFQLPHVKFTSKFSLGKFTSKFSHVKFTSKFSFWKFTSKFSHVKFTSKFSHVKFTSKVSLVKFTSKFSHVKFTSKFSHVKFTSKFSLGNFTSKFSHVKFTSKFSHVKIIWFLELFMCPLEVTHLTRSSHFFKHFTVKHVFLSVIIIINPRVVRYNMWGGGVNHTYNNIQCIVFILIYTIYKTEAALRLISSTRNIGNLLLIKNITLYFMTLLGFMTSNVSGFEVVNNMLSHVTGLHFRIPPGDTSSVR